MAGVHLKNFTDKCKCHFTQPQQPFIKSYFPVKLLWYIRNKIPFLHCRDLKIHNFSLLGTICYAAIQKVHNWRVKFWKCQNTTCACILNVLQGREKLFCAFEFFPIEFLFLKWTNFHVSLSGWQVWVLSCPKSTNNLVLGLILIA